MPAMTFNADKNKNISRLLSLVLRHQPQSIGIHLDAQGWTSVALLLQALNQHGKAVDFEVLKAVVDENDKKRFAFNEDFSQIRASQGHSVSVDLNYQPACPPEFLYHGTALQVKASILEQGLIKGSRHHVHLSMQKETALKVGQRHGKPIIFLVLSKQMHDAGFIFFKSDNDVWLTDHVPAQYLSLLIL